MFMYVTVAIFLLSLNIGTVLHTDHCKEVTFSLQQANRASQVRLEAPALAPHGLFQVDVSRLRGGRRGHGCACVPGRASFGKVR